MLYGLERMLRKSNDADGWLGYEYEYDDWGKAISYLEGLIAAGEATAGDATTTPGTAVP